MTKKRVRQAFNATCKSGADRRMEEGRALRIPYPSRAGA